MRNVLLAVLFSPIAIFISWDWQPRMRIPIFLFSILVVMYELTANNYLNRSEPVSSTAARYGFGALVLVVCFGYIAWWTGAFWPSWLQCLLLALGTYGLGYGVGYAKACLANRHSSDRRRMI
jgi:hypothetical protein